MVKRILVVDDDENIVALAAKGLTRLGTAYHAEVATSGEEAWEKMSVEPYDLVITDLRMPGMDGLELLRRTRKSYPQTRLILMTGYGSDEVEANARRLQAYHYITKPFYMQDLLDAARDALEGPIINVRGLLVLSDERFETITRQLGQLKFDTGAQAILLCDATGQTIVRVGETPDLNLNDLAVLVADGLNTTLEMRRMLGERHALNLNYHEGDRFDVYAAAVGECLLLLFVFDRRSQTSHIGIVWLYAKRAIETLRELTSSQDSPAADLEERLGETFFQETDDLFEDLFSEVSLEKAAAALLSLETNYLDKEGPAATPASASSPEPESTEEEPGLSAPLFSFEETLMQGLIQDDVI